MTDLTPARVAEMAAKATPGPWEQPDGADFGVMSAGYPTRMIHSMPQRPYYDRGDYDVWFEANRANAALIAAAPDLLEALKFADLWLHIMAPKKIRDMVEQAIAKAEGGKS